MRQSNNFVLVYLVIRLTHTMHSGVNHGTFLHIAHEEVC